MKKFFARGLVAVALGVMALAPAAPAQADSAGPAVAAGIGGLALGAILGGAARPPAVVYDAPPPVYVEAPRCWREKRPVYDEDGFVVGFRRQRVCE
jgi:hypothetical protein